MRIFSFIILRKRFPSVLHCIWSIRRLDENYLNRIYIQHILVYATMFSLPSEWWIDIGLSLEAVAWSDPERVVRSRPMAWIVRSSWVHGYIIDKITHLSNFVSPLRGLLDADWSPNSQLGGNWHVQFSQASSLKLYNEF